MKGTAKEETSEADGDASFLEEKEPKAKNKKSNKKEKEEADYYTNEAIENEEISEEERDDYYQEKYDEIVNDPINYLESLFGKKELPNYLIKYNALDFDAMAEAAAEIGYIKPEDISRLIAFRNNPSDESWIGGNK